MNVCFFKLTLKYNETDTVEVFKKILDSVSLVSKPKPDLNELGRMQAKYGITNILT